MNKDSINKSSAGGYFALATTSILWGTTWVASKVAVTQLPGLQVAYIRQFIAGSIFILFFALYKKLPLPTWKDFKIIFLMSVLMFVIANGLSSWGLKYLPTGLASLIGALSPLSVVVIEWVFYKKRNVSILTFIGLILGIAGVGFVFYKNMFSKIDGDLILGLSLSIVAMFSWSLCTVFLSRNKIGLNPYYSLGWQMILGSLMLFFIVHFTQTPVPILDISLKSWFAIFYLIGAGSLLSFIAFIYSLKKLPPAVSSLYAYINPIVAMISASILLQEKLTLTILMGTIVTLIGVYIVNHSIKRDQEKIIVEAEI